MKGLDLRRIKKVMLAKRGKQKRRIPLFVMARTNRRITTNIKRRFWRTQKLKLSTRNILRILGL